MAASTSRINRITLEPPQRMDPLGSGEWVGNNRGFPPVVDYLLEYDPGKADTVWTLDTRLSFLLAPSPKVLTNLHPDSCENLLVAFEPFFIADVGAYGETRLVPNTKGTVKLQYRSVDFEQRIADVVGRIEGESARGEGGGEAGRGAAEDEDEREREDEEHRIRIRALDEVRLVDLARVDISKLEHSGVYSFYIKKRERTLDIEECSLENFSLFLTARIYLSGQVLATVLPAAPSPRAPYVLVAPITPGGVKDRYCRWMVKRRGTDAHGRHALDGLNLYRAEFYRRLRATAGQRPLTGFLVSMSRAKSLRMCMALADADPSATRGGYVFEDPAAEEVDPDEWAAYRFPSLEDYEDGGRAAPKGMVGGCPKPSRSMKENGTTDDRFTPEALCTRRKAVYSAGAREGWEEVRKILYARGFSVEDYLAVVAECMHRFPPPGVSREVEFLPKSALVHPDVQAVRAYTVDWPETMGRYNDQAEWTQGNYGDMGEGEVPTWSIPFRAGRDSVILDFSTDAPNERGSFPGCMTALGPGGGLRSACAVAYDNESTGVYVCRALSGGYDSDAWKTLVAHVVTLVGPTWTDRIPQSLSPFTFGMDPSDYLVSGGLSRVPTDVFWFFSPAIQNQQPPSPRHGEARAAEEYRKRRYRAGLTVAGDPIMVGSQVTQSPQPVDRHASVVPGRGDLVHIHMLNSLVSQNRNPWYKDAAALARVPASNRADQVASASVAPVGLDRLMSIDAGEGGNVSASLAEATDRRLANGGGVLWLQLPLAIKPVEGTYVAARTSRRLDEDRVWDLRPPVLPAGRGDASGGVAPSLAAEFDTDARVAALGALLRAYLLTATRRDPLQHQILASYGAEAAAPSLERVESEKPYIYRAMETARRLALPDYERRVLFGLGIGEHRNGMRGQRPGEILDVTGEVNSGLDGGVYVPETLIKLMREATQERTVHLAELSYTFLANHPSAFVDMMEQHGVGAGWTVVSDAAARSRFGEKVVVAVGAVIANMEPGRLANEFLDFVLRQLFDASQRVQDPSKVELHQWPTSRSVGTPSSSSASPDWFLRAARADPFMGLSPVECLHVRRVEIDTLLATVEVEQDDLFRLDASPLIPSRDALSRLTRASGGSSGGFPTLRADYAWATPRWKGTGIDAGKAVVSGSDVAPAFHAASEKDDGIYTCMVEVIDDRAPYSTREPLPTYRAGSVWYPVDFEVRVKPTYTPEQRQNMVNLLAKEPHKYPRSHLLADLAWANSKLKPENQLMSTTLAAVARMLKRHRRFRSRAGAIDSPEAYAFGLLGAFLVEGAYANRGSRYRKPALGSSEIGAMFTGFQDRVSRWLDTVADQSPGSERRVSVDPPPHRSSNGYGSAPSPSPFRPSSYQLLMEVPFVTHFARHTSGHAELLKLFADARRREARTYLQASPPPSASEGSEATADRSGGEPPPPYSGTVMENKIRSLAHRIYTVLHKLETYRLERGQGAPVTMEGIIGGRLHDNLTALFGGIRVYDALVDWLEAVALRGDVSARSDPDGSVGKLRLIVSKLNGPLSQSDKARFADVAGEGFLTSLEDSLRELERIAETWGASLSKRVAMPGSVGNMAIDDAVALTRSSPAETRQRLLDATAARRGPSASGPIGLALAAYEAFERNMGDAIRQLEGINVDQSVLEAFDDEVEGWLRDMSAGTISDPAGLKRYMTGPSVYSRALSDPLVRNGASLSALSPIGYAVGAMDPPTSLSPSGVSDGWSNAEGAPDKRFATETSVNFASSMSVLSRILSSAEPWRSRLFGKEILDEAAAYLSDPLFGIARDLVLATLDVPPIELTRRIAVSIEDALLPSQDRREKLAGIGSPTADPTRSGILSQPTIADRMRTIQETLARDPDDFCHLSACLEEDQTENNACSPVCVSFVKYLSEHDAGTRGNPALVNSLWRGMAYKEALEYLSLRVEEDPRRAVIVEQLQQSRATFVRQLSQQYQNAVGAIGVEDANAVLSYLPDAGIADWTAEHISITHAHAQSVENRRGTAFKIDDPLVVCLPVESFAPSPEDAFAEALVPPLPPFVAWDTTAPVSSETDIEGGGAGPPRPASLPRLSSSTTPTAVPPKTNFSEIEKLQDDLDRLTEEARTTPLRPEDPRVKDITDKIFKLTAELNLSPEPKGGEDNATPETKEKREALERLAATAGPVLPLTEESAIDATRRNLPAYPGNMENLLKSPVEDPDHKAEREDRAQEVLDGLKRALGPEADENPDIKKMQDLIDESKRTPVPPSAIPQQEGSSSGPSVSTPARRGSTEPPGGVGPAGPGSVPVEGTPAGPPGGPGEQEPGEPGGSVPTRATTIPQGGTRSSPPKSGPGSTPVTPGGGPGPGPGGRGSSDIPTGATTPTVPGGGRGTSGLRFPTSGRPSGERSRVPVRGGTEPRQFGSTPILLPTRPSVTEPGGGPRGRAGGTEQVPRPPTPTPGGRASYRTLREPTPGQARQVGPRGPVGTPGKAVPFVALLGDSVPLAIQAHQPIQDPLEVSARPDDTPVDAEDPDNILAAAKDLLERRLFDRARDLKEDPKDLPEPLQLRLNEMKEKVAVPDLDTIAAKEVMDQAIQLVKDISEVWRKTACANSRHVLPEGDILGTIRTDGTAMPNNPRKETTGVGSVEVREGSDYVAKERGVFEEVQHTGTELGGMELKKMWLTDTGHMSRYVELIEKMEAEINRRPPVCDTEEGWQAFARDPIPVLREANADMVSRVTPEYDETIAFLAENEGFTGGDQLIRFFSLPGRELAESREVVARLERAADELEAQHDRKHAEARSEAAAAGKIGDNVEEAGRRAVLAEERALLEQARILATVAKMDLESRVTSVACRPTVRFHVAGSSVLALVLEYNEVRRIFHVSGFGDPLLRLAERVSDSLEAPGRDRLDARDRDLAWWKELARRIGELQREARERKDPVYRDVEALDSVQSLGRDSLDPAMAQLTGLVDRIAEHLKGVSDPDDVFNARSEGLRSEARQVMADSVPALLAWIFARDRNTGKELDDSLLGFRQLVVKEKDAADDYVSRLGPEVAEIMDERKALLSSLKFDPMSRALEGLKEEYAGSPELTGDLEIDGPTAFGPWYSWPEGGAERVRKHLTKPDEIPELSPQEKAHLESDVVGLTAVASPAAIASEERKGDPEAGTPIREALKQHEDQGHQQQQQQQAPGGASARPASSAGAVCRLKLPPAALVGKEEVWELVKDREDCARKPAVGDAVGAPPGRCYNDTTLRSVLSAAEWGRLLRGRSATDPSSTGTLGPVGAALFEAMTDEEEGGLGPAPSAGAAGAIAFSGGVPRDVARGAIRPAYVGGTELGGPGLADLPSYLSALFDTRYLALYHDTSAIPSDETSTRVTYGRTALRISSMEHERAAEIRDGRENRIEPILRNLLSNSSIFFTRKTHPSEDEWTVYIRYGTGDGSRWMSAVMTESHEISGDPIAIVAKEMAKDKVEVVFEYGVSEGKDRRAILDGLHPGLSSESRELARRRSDVMQTSLERLRHQIFKRGAGAPPGSEARRLWEQIKALEWRSSVPLDGSPAGMESEFIAYLRTHDISRAYTTQDTSGGDKGDIDEELTNV